MEKGERLRLFVAVSVPKGHLDLVDSQISPLRDKLVNARWIAPENQHITLKFLGTTPSDRLDEIEKVCAMIAASHQPSDVTLTEVGAFPSRTRVRVMWVGIDDPSDLLAGLAGDLDQAFEPLGYASEARAFTPHLTLCRFKIPVPMKSGLPNLDLSGLDAVTIDRVGLFRSYLSPKGARYERMSVFPLAAA